LLHIVGIHSMGFIMCGTYNIDLYTVLISAVRRWDITALLQSGAGQKSQWAEWSRKWGSKNQVHERERSGSRVGGRRNSNEAVSESPVNGGESWAGNFAAPFRSHALHTNILGSVQIWSQQNKWVIHLKVYCVSLIDIQRFTTDWLNRPNKCFIASPGRASPKASDISRLVR